MQVLWSGDKNSLLSLIEAFRNQYRLNIRTEILPKEYKVLQVHTVLTPVLKITLEVKQNELPASLLRGLCTLPLLILTVIRSLALYNHISQELPASLQMAITLPSSSRPNWSDLWVYLTYLPRVQDLLKSTERASPWAKSQPSSWAALEPRKAGTFPRL